MNVFDYKHGADEESYDGSNSEPDPGANDMPLQFSSRNGPTIIERSNEGDDRSRLLNQAWPAFQGRTGGGGGGGVSFNDADLARLSAELENYGLSRDMLIALSKGGYNPGFGNPQAALPGPQFGPGVSAQQQAMMAAGYHGGADPVDMPTIPRKPVLHFKGFTLFPPTTFQGSPPVGERPPGCKTIFVGGQPEKMTEEMINDLFTKHGGKIMSYRQGKRNFCHIRFAEEKAVDNAMFVSGYRVRIGANIDEESNGRLRVDFAQNRNDQYEYECEQRRRAREARHLNVDEPGDPGKSTPTVVPRYSPVEGHALLPKIKAEDTFPHAINLLITWLERGECEKKNANQFYGLVQASHIHVRRLIAEKSQCDQQLNAMQQRYRMQITGLLTQYTLIEQVMVSACKQKAWDNFTKAQRKNIESWKQQTQELRQQQQEELGLGEKGEADMDMSDDEGDSSEKTDENESAAKRVKTETKDEDTRPEEQLQLQVQALMHQNGVLRSQLDVYRNKVESMTTLAPPGTTPVAPPPPGQSEETDTQIRALQHSLLSMQQQLQETKNRLKREESARKEAEEKLESVKPENIQGPSNSGARPDAGEGGIPTRTPDVQSSPGTRSMQSIDHEKATMIGLLSIFLNVHPFGASTEYLWSYMQRVNPTVTMEDIESLLISYPSLFRQDLFGVGATLEKRWRYIVFSKFLTGQDKRVIRFCELEN